MAPALAKVASWFRTSKRRSRHESEDSFDNIFGSPLLSVEQQQEAADTGGEFTITLSRDESGLGLVFDADYVVTKLHPGCAAERHGGVQAGDRLLAVDGYELQPGDRVGALFPMSVTTFELRLLRLHSAGGAESLAAPTRGSSFFGKGDASAASFTASTKPQHMHHAQRVALRREQCGKFESTRPAPVFQEVVWNEYCVLFPDGSSAPFNEAVRYTALTGYLRKKPVVTDGRAEFALLHGEPQRGWSRHFCHLSMKQLAWFDEDPQLAMERQRARAQPSLTRPPCALFPLPPAPPSPPLLSVARRHRQELALVPHQGA